MRAFVALPVLNAANASNNVMVEGDSNVIGFAAIRTLGLKSLEGQ